MNQLPQSMLSQKQKYLTKNLDGKKEFADFTYNGMDASVADITFTHNELFHRGWFIMLNGDEFDYYIYSYSFESAYENSLSLLLSALYSFCQGND